MSGKALKSIIIVFVLAVAAVGYWVTKDHIAIILNDTQPQEVAVEVDITPEIAPEVIAETPEVVEEAKTEPETAAEVEAEVIPTPTPKTAEEEPTAKTSDFDVKAAMEDRIEGDPNAPLTIHEYASMTCSHCATFYKDTFPTIKKKFIDTGKVKFIFHEFPLDAYALTAAKVTRCLPKDQFFNMLEVFFTNQKRWLQAKDPRKAIAQLSALAGMNEESFNTCNDNKELEEAMMEVMKKAQEEYNIQAVPTFVINNGDDVISGARPLPEFEMIIQDALAMQAVEQQGK